MHWILIVMLLGPKSDRATVTMQEFNTRAACENARTLILQHVRDPRDVVNITCVEKGK